MGSIEVHVGCAGSVLRRWKDRHLFGAVGIQEGGGVGVAKVRGGKCRWLEGGGNLVGLQNSHPKMSDGCVCMCECIGVVVFTMGEHAHATAAAAAVTYRQGGGRGQGGATVAIFEKCSHLGVDDLRSSLTRCRGSPQGDLFCASSG
jgi:hypothetical protein